MSRRRVALGLVGLAWASGAVACGGDASQGTGPAGDGGKDAAARDGTVTEDAGTDAPVDDGGADSSSAVPVDAGAGDAEGGPAATAPRILASDVPNPSFLVTDGAYLYWTDFVDSDAGALGRVMKMSVTGGIEITLATETGMFPAGLAVDSANVYWVDDHATLFAASLEGGAPFALYGAAGQSTIGTDGQFVYFESSLGAGVARVPVEGGAAVTLATPDAGFMPAGIAIDTANVYWPAPAGGAILAIPKGGGTTITLASNGDAGAGAFVSATNYQNVVSDGTAVYWNLYPGGPALPGGVLSVTLEGGALSLLFDAGAATPLSVVADGASVYFLLSGSAPAIMRAPVDGGAPVVLAGNQFSAGITGDPGPTLAVDGTSVYWLSPPQILSIAK